ncbi:MAG: hypothetical protein M1546_25380 [Chloroflexi bacterium]|nr:hypothetical protein [Chloroflexota bacterium]
MPRKPESRGTCAYCGELITKRSVSKHLDKCPKRLETLQSAAASRRPVETLWHIRIQDAYDKDYWLNLEMNGSAPLEKLDDYLRAIWLECCGHLSKFTIGEGKPTTKHPIALLARNVMPEAVCQECGQPARWLCIECLYEENKTGHLCNDHVEDHPHDNYGEPMPLFNSPRVGMCGYDGPAEPPY